MSPSLAMFVGDGDLTRSGHSVCETEWQPERKEIMTGDSNHPSGFAHRTPSTYHRWAIEILVTLGLAMILFVFLLFAMLAGTEATEDDGSEHDFEAGLSGL
jgi:hypothetical protein